MSDAVTPSIFGRVFAHSLKQRAACEPKAHTDTCSLTESRAGNLIPYHVSLCKRRAGKAFFLYYVPTLSLISESLFLSQNPRHNLIALSHLPHTHLLPFYFHPFSLANKIATRKSLCENLPT